MAKNQQIERLFMSLSFKQLRLGFFSLGILGISIPSLAVENTVSPETPTIQTSVTEIPTIQAAQQTAPTPPLIINQVQVSGSTVFNNATDFRVLTQPLEGKDFSTPETQRAAQDIVDKITQLYLERGFLTSRASLVNTIDPRTGILQIRILEGSVEKIVVEGLRRLDENYVRSRVALALSTPINTTRVENQLRLLRSDPLIENIEASLRSGSQPGRSELLIRVTEANSGYGGITLDNYSPPSVGSERATLTVGNRNITGAGDDGSLTYSRTLIGGADSLDLNYRLPINPQNGDLRVRASISRNVVLQPPFDTFNIRGESQLYDLTFRQPVIRTPQEELAFSVGLSYQSGQTFTFAGPTPFGIGPAADGTSRTTTLKLGQEYTARDPQGAWNFRSQFGLGLGIFNATINSHPIPDGRFLTWLGQIQRLQVLDTNNFLIIQADIQLSPNSLLPAQQFVIGGGQSVRGFRQNARAGDNGIRLSIEDRMTLETNESGSPTLVFAPFLEGGRVWNNPSNPNVLGTERFIAGVGAGLIWQPIPKFSARIDYGIPLVNLSDRGNNLQDSGFYFSLGYQF